MKIEIDKKSYWYVAMNTDVDSRYPGKRRMIQALKDIYPIVEPFDDDKLKVNEDADVCDVFEKFNEMIDKCVQSPLKTVNIIYDKKYKLKAYCYHNVINQTLYAMPLSFLPDLGRHNKKLHNIIVDCMRLMNQKQVSILEMQEGMQEEDIENCIANDDSDNVPSKDLIWEHAYKAKFESNYRNMFLTFCHVDNLAKRVAKYPVKYEAEGYLIEFAKMIIKAYREPNDMEFFNTHAMETYGDLNEHPKNEDGYYAFDNGQPVAPKDTIMFVWYKEEWIHEIMCQWMGETSENYGEAEFAMDYTCKTADDLRNIRGTFLNDVGKFPEYLSEAIKYANNHQDAIYSYSQGQLTFNIITKDEQCENVLQSLSCAESIS